MNKFYLVYMNQNDNIRIDEVAVSNYNAIDEDKFYSGDMGYSKCEYIGKTNSLTGLIDLINNF